MVSPGAGVAIRSINETIPIVMTSVADPDFGRHWTEETPSTADRKKLVHLIKERSAEISGSYRPSVRSLAPNYFLTPR
jgi:hypothetical protein